MNIDRLLHRFFMNQYSDTKMYVFDAENIYSVYSEIVNSLMSNAEVELSILQSLSYCFYEILDNVLTHSGKQCGTVMIAYDASAANIKILVADDGLGIRSTLTQNPQFAHVTEEDAVRNCIRDKVTDGKGMGFGLYSTARLIKSGGIKLVIHSGCSELFYNGKDMEVAPTDFWQGTVVYFELDSNRIIDPNDVVENRTDCEDMFNETFLGNEELNKLW